MEALYFGGTCKRCGQRFGKSLVGRSMFKVVSCPYCGYRNRVKEMHFVLFSSHQALREWCSQA